MRTFATFKRILLQRCGDKRSLALLFIAPLLILGLLRPFITGAIKCYLSCGSDW